MRMWPLTLNLHFSHLLETPAGCLSEEVMILTEEVMLNDGFSLF